VSARDSGVAPAWARASAPGRPLPHLAHAGGIARVIRHGAAVGYDALHHGGVPDRHPVQPIISVGNLSKTYASGFQALKSVDLEIRPGEIFANDEVSACVP